MRKAAATAVRGIASVLVVLALGLAAVFTAALALGATALVVPGTGTPNPDTYPEYVQDARNYYLGDTPCGAAGACLTLGEDLIGIDYPASFWPLTFIPGWCAADCQKWDVSVGEGVANLAAALAAALGADPQDPLQDVVVFGHSQGAAVVSNTLRTLGTSLSQAQKDRVQIVVTGNVDNPAGGMWSRIGFLGRIPFIDLTTGLPTPTDTGIRFTSIAMQYDGASNAPKYWGNVLSLLNAVAGFAYLHGTTLIPDERTPVGVPDFYPTVEEYLAAVYDPANAKRDAAGNTYIVVPSPILPITLPFLDVAARTGTTWLVKPIVDLVSPVLRVLIDLGYDPHEEPGVYSPLSLLPFSLRTNPFQVAVDLVEAVVQGLHDFIRGGAPLPAAPRVSLGVPPPVDAESSHRSMVMSTPVQSVGDAAPAGDTATAVETAAPEEESAASDTIPETDTQAVVEPVVDPPVEAEPANGDAERQSTGAVTDEPTGEQAADEETVEHADDEQQTETVTETSAPEDEDENPDDAADLDTDRDKTDDADAAA